LGLNLVIFHANLCFVAQPCHSTEITGFQLGKKVLVMQRSINLALTLDLASEEEGEFTK